MVSTTTFTGFPKEGLELLEQLQRNNTREWFENHRDEYESLVLDPSRAFVVAMGERLRELVPAIRFEPRVNGSLFRINRDTRFSKDKTPYKTNIGIVFWEGEKRMESPGFYFHLQPGTLLLAAGMHMMGKEHLERYRQAAVDPTLGPALRTAFDQVEAFTGKDPFAAVGCGFENQHYKRVPKGFDPDHANADLLRLKGVGASMELPSPPEVHHADLVDYCLERYRGMLPIEQWLTRAVFS